MMMRKIYAENESDKGRGSPEYVRVCKFQIDQSK